MIKSVTVTNHLGESLRMELGRPETSGFYIKKIDGLGPCKANINITERATVDGALYSSAHVNSRNIVMSLGFMFAHDIEEVRHKSYKYFPLKKSLKLLIETDKRTCETYGYVESNEPDIFSKDETTQISIICPNPYFYSAGEGSTNVTMFSGTESMFEFPFSNESVEDVDEIIFGEIQHDTIRSIIYSGESEIGVMIYIHATGPASNVTIQNVYTREVMSIDTSKLKDMTGSEIIAGDDIIISTIKGEKSIKLIRDGAVINILNCIGKYANWFQLVNGDNVFIYTADVGADNLEFRIENRIAYEGV